MQRFNSSLELSLHFHSLIPDGVFVSDHTAGPDARPRFIALAEPCDEEIAALLDTIIRRIVAMLRRRGRLDDDGDGGDDDPQLLLAARPAGGVALAPSEDPLPPRCARKDGFSLHAGIGVHENDRAGLEYRARFLPAPAGGPAPSPRGAGRHSVHDETPPLRRRNGRPDDKVTRFR